MIGIHHREGSFSEYWISYCVENGLDFKLVDCYKTGIIKELSECDALMWHIHHTNSKDVLFSKQLLYSIDRAGKTVFPDIFSSWHFDDKVGQKYLLEAVKAPLVRSYVFYDKEEALRWVESALFPKVFKLRKGSGSSHVILVENRRKAKKLVNKAFGKGFQQYNSISNLKERWRKLKNGDAGLTDFLKGFARLGYTTEFNRIAGNEKGYVYFQDFIPGNSYDMRLTVVSGNCFACTRRNRPGDFKASGSGLIEYDMDKIPIAAVQAVLSTARKLNLQSAAFDVLMDGFEPKILEMSYGFGIDPDDFSFGYWNSDLEFISGEFNPFGWMVEDVLKEIKEKSLFN